MRKDVDPFWALVGALSALLCAGVLALTGWETYSRAQIMTWLLASVLYRFRWTEPGRKPSEAFMIGLAWPAVLVGSYWYVRNEERRRKMRIVRDVMES
jgi:hypothetical protein